MKARCLLAINENKNWAISGWDGAQEYQLEEALATVTESGQFVDYHWVEMEVPVPQEPLNPSVTKATREWVLK